MHVGIVGGGVAGLVSAKVLKQDGFDVTVFEKEPGIGGVWAESRAYPGLSTNNPRETYVFSDFPHADTIGDFPSAGQVREYLEGYVDHFGLWPHLRLGTEVVSVARKPADQYGAHQDFRVRVRPVHGEAGAETLMFDFVVVCNGVLSEPVIPRFEGVERFGGQVIHSSQTPEAPALRGKRVVVVGAGKSALDCANFAGKHATTCTLVFRRPYWMLPRYFFGRKRVDRQVFNRVTEMITFPAYHEISRGEAAARTIGAPLRPLLWGLRRLQCRLIARQAGIPRMMRPEAPIHRHIFHQGIGAEVYDGVREGLVEPRRAGISCFVDNETLRLNTGEELAADMVICGTGWRQQIGFLDSDLQRQIRPNDAFRLYRHVLPPAEPRMGFVGYASSGNAPLTSEVAAHWLSRCFLGELALPPRADMEASVDRVLEWTARAFPEQSQGHFIGGYIAHYVDWLMRDMGLEPRRTSGVIQEYLGPFWAERYRDLPVQRLSRSRRFRN